MGKHEKNRNLFKHSPPALVRVLYCSCAEQARMEMDQFAFPLSLRSDAFNSIPSSSLNYLFIVRKREGKLIWKMKDFFSSSRILISFLAVTPVSTEYTRLSSSNDHHHTEQIGPLFLLLLLFFQKHTRNSKLHIRLKPS